LKEVEIIVEKSPETLRQEAVNCISIGDLEKADKIFKMLRSKEITDSRVKTDTMYVEFWLSRKPKYQETGDHYKRGIFILRQWKVFLDYIKDREPDGKVFSAIKTRIFSQALHSFSRFASESRISDSATLFHIGVCYKNIGNYMEAIQSLEKANSKKNSDAAVLSELADCYEMVNQTRLARLFFREAFYIDPQKIDLDGLESLMINQLATGVRNMGYSGDALKEWIPVYGVLKGLFDIKRELRPLEAAQLRQSIVTLETAINDGENVELFIPRLINRYFWLLDFYDIIGNNSGARDATLKKIRDLTPAVYELYTN